MLNAQARVHSDVSVFTFLFQSFSVLKLLHLDPKRIYCVDRRGQKAEKKRRVQKYPCTSGREPGHSDKSTRADFVSGVTATNTFSLPVPSRYTVETVGRFHAYQCAEKQRVSNTPKHSIIQRVFPFFKPTVVAECSVLLI